MKNSPDIKAATEFDKFKELTQKLMAVPKKEVDKKAAEHKSRTKKTSQRRKTKGG